MIWIGSSRSPEVKQGDVTGHEHPRERLRNKKTLGPYFLVVFCKPMAYSLVMCSGRKVGEGEEGGCSGVFGNRGVTSFGLVQVGVRRW